MIWALLKKVPKYALVLILIVGSSVAFCGWWYFYSAKKALHKALYEGHPVPAEDIGPKLAQVETKWGRLMLVDNDLYDFDSGGVIFKRWLKEGMPLRLFYDGETKKFLAQYERGFVRYDLRGTAEATRGQKFKPAFSDDFKWMVYAKNKDIWRADVDWKDFKLVNEKRVTAIEQFNEQNFADNIFLGTEKTLVVRNMPNLLRVNLETGDVKPTRISLQNIGNRKSPDSKIVIGVENGNFYCYDVDADDAKMQRIGRGAVNDYQWLGNDRCVAIAAGKTAILYDRLKNELTTIAELPYPCGRIGDPSPDRRFVFCSGRGGVLVDVDKKTAVPVVGGAGICWVSNDTFAFSRELPNSDLRGTWLQTVGEGERRVSTEPYLVNKTGPALMALKPAGVVIFATKHGLCRMKPDGTEVSDLVKLVRPASRVLGIEEWNR
jgi:hypothetical protein